MRLKVLFSDEDFDRGEVVDAALGTLPDGRIMVRANGSSGCEHRFYYDSIDGFIKDWADPYEEPKEYWFVSDNGYICSCIDDGDSWDEHRKEVGNYFSSREEAEQVVEKLKAWRRLRELGLFRWGSLNEVKAACDYRHYVGIERDFETLFGGEE